MHISFQKTLVPSFMNLGIDQKEKLTFFWDTLFQDFIVVNLRNIRKFLHFCPASIYITEISETKFGTRLRSKVFSLVKFMVRFKSTIMTKNISFGGSVPNHLGEFPIRSYLKVKRRWQNLLYLSEEFFFISSESLFEWLYFEPRLLFFGCPLHGLKWP